MTAVAYAAVPQVQARPARRDDWPESLREVPLGRIVLDPPPGSVTLAYYAALDGRHGGVLVELVDNTLVEKPVGRYESEIAMWLVVRIGNHILARRLGGKLSGPDGMLEMSGGNGREPDVCWTAPEDVTDPDRKHKVPAEPPTFAVEVVSEGNTEAELDRKRREYFASGCRLAVWLYPRTRSARVFTAADDAGRELGPDDALDGGNVLPGFSVRVGDLFDV